MEPIILVHGGAGNIRDWRVLPKIEGVKTAAKVAYEILEKGGNALDAVEQAVRILEDDESMNAGRGSVLNEDGEVAMDACIMDGQTLDAGSVAVVKDIAHPITLARLVMEKTPHTFLAGHGANRFAKENGMKILSPGSLVTKDALYALEYFKKHGGIQGDCGDIENPGEVGTVGAVAIDCRGHVAAATSTGGLNGKMEGRVGDTPQIGGGTYADDETGAASATGHGESIMKFCVTHSIITAIRNNLDPQEATDSVLNRMTEKLKQTAGAISISKTGDIGIGMTTKRMPWAYRKGNTLFYGIEQGKQHSEVLVE
ncbi:hypothetical protein HHI36_015807 [Cryptolaemus montrouzieri]|uniref:Asparaginase n=1 Tax=Cryptolaemus montrouzieri TaxID=559131 RepID=A0ABD2N6Q3_9CUCU